MEIQEAVLKPQSAERSPLLRLKRSLQYLQSSVRIQDVCNPSVAITPIIYDISGSASVISPTAWNELGLPNGITANHTKIKQVNTINVTSAATGTHSIAINGEVFTFGTGASSTANAIREGLKGLINNSVQ